MLVVVLGLYFDDFGDWELDGFAAAEDLAELVLVGGVGFVVLVEFYYGEFDERSDLGV